ARHPGSAGRGRRAARRDRRARCSCRAGDAAECARCGGAMTSRLGLAVLLAACGPTSYQAATPGWVNDTSSIQPKTPTPIADHYREVAETIIETARKDRGAYTKLSELTDKIGNRLAGSASLDRAIAWAAQTMKDDGLDVRTEKVMVPHWARGTQAAAV